LQYQPLLWWKALQECLQVLRIFAFAAVGRAGSNGDARDMPALFDAKATDQLSIDGPQAHDARRETAFASQPKRQIGQLAGQLCLFQSAGGRAERSVDFSGECPQQISVVSAGNGKPGAEPGSQYWCDNDLFTMLGQQRER